MPPGFTSSLAARLDGTSALTVRESAGGETLDAHTALLAPGGQHLRLRSDGRTTLSDEDAIGGLRPRADLLIEDAAKLFGERLLLVVMTGMGCDGLRGAREVRRAAGASSSSPRRPAPSTECRGRSPRPAWPTRSSPLDALAGRDRRGSRRAR